MSVIPTAITSGSRVTRVVRPRPAAGFVRPSRPAVPRHRRRHLPAPCRTPGLRPPSPVRPACRVQPLPRAVRGPVSVLRARGPAPSGSRPLEWTPPLQGRGLRRHISMAPPAQGGSRGPGGFTDPGVAFPARVAEIRSLTSTSQNWRQGRDFSSHEALVPLSVGPGAHSRPLCAEERRSAPPSRWPFCPHCLSTSRLLGVRGQPGVRGHRPASNKLTLHRPLTESAVQTEAV